MESSASLRSLEALGRPFGTERSSNTSPRSEATAHRSFPRILTRSAEDDPSEAADAGAVEPNRASERVPEAGARGLDPEASADASRAHPPETRAEATATASRAGDGPEPAGPATERPSDGSASPEPASASRTAQATAHGSTVATPAVAAEVPVGPPSALPGTGLPTNGPGHPGSGVTGATLGAAAPTAAAGPLGIAASSFGAPTEAPGGEAPGGGVPVVELGGELAGGPGTDAGGNLAGDGLPQALAPSGSAAAPAGQAAPEVAALAGPAPAGTTPAALAEAPSTPLPEGPLAQHDLERAGAILQQVKVALSPALREAVIHLRPAELGRIAIKFTIVDGRASAVVRAESVEALDVLNRHLPELRASLEQQGLKADDFDIGLGFSGDRQGGGLFAGGGGAESDSRPTSGARPDPRPTRGVDRSTLAKALAGAVGVDLYA